MLCHPHSHPMHIQNGLVVRMTKRSNPKRHFCFIECNVLLLIKIVIVMSMLCILGFPFTKRVCACVVLHFGKRELC